MEIRQFKKPTRSRYAKKVDEPITLRNGKRTRGHMDFPLFIMVLIISLFGLVMMFSASYYNALMTKGDGLHFVTTQIKYLAIGLAGMYGMSLVNYKFLKKNWVWISAVLLTIGVLAAILVFGVEKNGSKRWLQVTETFTVQPSEIAKFAVILFMSVFMSNHPERVRKFWSGMVPMLIVLGIICGLIILQPNLSMMAIVAFTGFLMLLVGGAKMPHLAVLLLIVVGGILILAIIEPYRLKRLMVFIDPWADPRGDGYQLIQSLYALGSGGLFGKGLNFSHQKLLFLTYAESDFIFAVIGEELGFAGAFALILSYIYVIYRGIRIAMRCKERFGSLLAAGITIVLAVQVAVNIGVATSALPPTGQTLPFISSGGTSLIIFLLAMGVLLNISRNTE